MASSIYNYNSVKKMPTFDITFYSIVKNKLSNLKFNNQGNIYILSEMCIKKLSLHVYNVNIN